MSYKISKNQLLFDLYVAFFCAKQHKAKKPYVEFFEKNLHNNLVELCDEIWERRYKPQPSTCFIIREPKKREIFAANFRDRIVHHLYYNYTYDLYNSTFIEDSYSCRIGKGTHYGIERLHKHIRSATVNFSKEAFVLKLDIRGYFIHINREILLKLTEKTLLKLKNHKVPGNKENITWGEKIDYDLVMYLNHELILLDPTENCIFKSDKTEWLTLDKQKSLFNSGQNNGLPIGNLTSQLLSNVYLNELDQFIKRELKCKYYGRYVDDFFIINENKDELRNLTLKIRDFLKRNFNLDLNMGKTILRNVKYGVEFVGGFVKNNRKYVSNNSLRRINRHLYCLKYKKNQDIFSSVNSYLGLLSHYKSFKIKKKIIEQLNDLLINVGMPDDDYSKLIKSNSNN